MSPAPRAAIADLVHQALVARVRVLLGQSGFDELLAVQERVSQALAQAVFQALELDPHYYGGSELGFIVSEGLTSAGLALAEAVRGHEADSRARWQAEVVPRLDRVAAFVVSVFEGAWARDAARLPLSRALA